MRFDKINENTFKQMQLGAGVLVENFNPATAELTTSQILGSTSGGVNFSAVPSFIDNGEDVDNCPKNMKELKALETWEIKMSGTFVSADINAINMLVGAGDVSSDKITPRNDLQAKDFKDLWWIGDYSEFNGAKNGGFVAIHMMNTLSTGGFAIQSGDKAKGQFAFEFTAHYSMEHQETVPFEVYVKAGTAEG